MDSIDYVALCCTVIAGLIYLVPFAPSLVSLLPIVGGFIYYYNKVRNPLVKRIMLSLNDDECLLFYHDKQNNQQIVKAKDDRDKAEAKVEDWSRDENPPETVEIDKTLHCEHNINGKTALLARETVEENYVLEDITGLPKTFEIYIATILGLGFGLMFIIPQAWMGLAIGAFGLAGLWYWLHSSGAYNILTLSGDETLMEYITKHGKIHFVKTKDMMWNYQEFPNLGMSYLSEKSAYNLYGSMVVIHPQGSNCTITPEVSAIAQQKKVNGDWSDFSDIPNKYKPEEGVLEKVGTTSNNTKKQRRREKPTIRR